MATLTSSPGRGGTAASPGAGTGERHWEPVVSGLGAASALRPKGEKHGRRQWVASGRALFSWSGSVGSPLEPAWSQEQSPEECCPLSREVAQVNLLLGSSF